MTALQADVAAVKELSDICAKIKRLNDGGFPTKNTETNLYYAAYNAGPAIERLLGIVSGVQEYEDRLLESAQALMKLGDTYGSGLQAGLADALKALLDREK